MPVPTPRGREVLLEVTGRRPVPLRPLRDDAASEGTLPYDLPLTLGHEVAGRVVAVGDAADGSLVGRDGVVHGVWSCGECHNCRRGRDNHCVALDGRVGCGLGRDGGLADVRPAARRAPLRRGRRRAADRAGAAGRRRAHRLPRDPLAARRAGGGVHGPRDRRRRTRATWPCRSSGATTAAQVVAVDPRPEARALADGPRRPPHRGLGRGGDGRTPGADVVLDFVGSDETMAAGALGARAGRAAGRGRWRPRQHGRGQGPGAAAGLAGERAVLGIARRPGRRRRARRAGAARPGRRGGAVRPR